MTRPEPPAVEGLPPGARPALELLAALAARRGTGLRLADLPAEFLDALLADPPGSLPARLGAAVAVRAIREARAARSPLRWPARIDPDDPALAAEGARLAALALAGATAPGGGDPAPDPRDRVLVDPFPGEEALVARFLAAEERLRRLASEPVDYPAADFLRDLREVPDRIPPGAADPSAPVARLHAEFRARYGDGPGERRAGLFLAILGYLSRRRRALEAAGDVVTDPSTGRFAFRDGFLEGLLARPPAWFDGA